MAISEKDRALLLSKVNKLLADYHARIMIDEAPEALLSFYEDNQHLINGEVVIVRTKENEPDAAHKRNTCDKVLFVFSDSYWVTSYFSGVCNKVNLPQALINRTVKELAQYILLKAKKLGGAKFYSVGLGINPYPEHTYVFAEWERGFSETRENYDPNKSKNAKRVLQLMDSEEDGGNRYQEFVKLVSEESGDPIQSIEKELEPFI
jgi:hypothetical protein